MRTILVVDDYPFNRQYVMSVLEDLPYRVIEAANGVAALDIARATHLDLIITDISMPQMDGYELIRHLNADPDLAQTPVVFYTGKNLDRDAQAMAKKFGVSTVITKPASPDLILDTVEEVFAKPASAPVF